MDKNTNLTVSIIYYSKSIVSTVTGMFLKECLVSRVPSAKGLKNKITRYDTRVRRCFCWAWWKILQFFVPINTAPDGTMADALEGLFFANELMKVPKIQDDPFIG